MDTSSAVSAQLDHGAASPPSAVSEGHVLGLGVEVARDRVRVALVDAVGTIRARAERRDVRATPAARARAVAVLAHSCSEDVEARLGTGKSVELRHAVVAFPAVVGTDHASVYRVPGHEKGGTALRDALVDALGCPVILENDVNLAAIAEHRHGAAQGESTFVTLMLDDGFGAGIMLDGHLHRGTSGLAGEVAFIPQPGRALGTQVLGDVALAALAKEHGLPETLRMGDVVDRAEAGDEVADDVVREVAQRLGVVVASLAIVLDPGLFVLGDQAARPLILDRVSAWMRDQVAVLPARVVGSPLGADAAVRGAAQAASEALR